MAHPFEDASRLVSKVSACGLQMACSQPSASSLHDGNEYGLGYPLLMTYEDASSDQGEGLPQSVYLEVRLEAAHVAWLKGSRVNDPVDDERLRSVVHAYQMASWLGSHD